MASNYTPVYGLNQWSLEDNFLMAEFNTDNRKIEQALLDKKNRIQTGSYVGNGAYGAADANSLTFDFEPQLVIVVPEPESFHSHQNLDSAQSASPLIAIRGATSFPLSYDTSQVGTNYYNSALINLSWDGNTVSWYSNEENSYTQYNFPDLTYRYIAIG